VQFKQIEVCRLSFDDGRPDIEEGHVRINGDSVSISEWEYVKAVAVLSTGEEVDELRPTYRTIQVERLTGAEVRDGKRGELTVQGFRTVDGRQTDQPLVVRVFPDLNRCPSC
jgi:hypothetical protein